MKTHEQSHARADGQTPDRSDVEKREHDHTAGAGRDDAIAVTTDGLPGWLDPVVRAARTVEPPAAQPLPAARERRAGASPPC